MPVKHRSKRLGLAFLSLLTSFPVFVGLYFADPGTPLLSRSGRGEGAAAGVRAASRVLRDTVVLPRNRHVMVNNTRLVYRGLNDRQILLEFYLLQLDPETPYRERISKDDAQKGFRLGDAVFQLHSLKKSVLTLRIKALYLAY